VEPQILFEDDAALVIDKPAGLIVHSDGRTKEPSVAEWALARYPALKDVGEPWTSPQGEVVERPGIVHRLDRTTSGVMILAKTHEAYTFLKAQFGERTVSKTYLAYAYGHQKRDSGIIEAEIVRLRSTPPRWGVRRGAEEKKHRAAVTEWRVEKCGHDADTGAPVSYMILVPKTGRTHQIRVHLKHLGHPVVCDHLYAKGKQCLLGFERPALHAYALSLTIPSGEGKMFVAPLPADFEEAARRFTVA
jgi:23S rRNA pseudouridine1911/1915/1917 synthase